MWMSLKMMFKGVCTCSVSHILFCLCYCFPVAGGIAGDWMHFLAVNPACLFSLQALSHSALLTDLTQVFPKMLYSHVPQLKAMALGGPLRGQVLIHDPDTNALHVLNPSGKELRSVNFKTLMGSTKEKLTRHFSVEQGRFVMRKDFANESVAIIYQENSNKMDAIDLAEEITQHITFPFVIGGCHPFSRDLWLVTETGTQRPYLLSKPFPEAPVPCVLHPITDDVSDGLEDEHEIKSISTRGLPHDILCSALGDDKRSRSNRLLAGEDYASVAVAQPDQLIEKCPVSFYSFRRSPAKLEEYTGKWSRITKQTGKTRTHCGGGNIASVIMFPKSQVAQAQRLSCEMWHPMVGSFQCKIFRQMFNKTTCWNLSAECFSFYGLSYFVPAFSPLRAGTELDQGRWNRSDKW